MRPIFNSLFGKIFACFIGGFLLATLLGFIMIFTIRSSIEKELNAYSLFRNVRLKVMHELHRAPNISTFSQKFEANLARDVAALHILDQTNLKTVYSHGEELSEAVRKKLRQTNDDVSIIVDGYTSWRTTLRDGMKLIIVIQAKLRSPFLRPSPEMNAQGKVSNLWVPHRQMLYRNLIVLCTVLLFSWILAGYLARPITKLQKVVTNYKQGNLSCLSGNIA